MAIIRAVLLAAALSVQPGSSQTNTWQALSPSGSPTARDGHRAVFIESRQCMLIFSGFAASMQNELHEYCLQSNAWQELTATNSAPAARLNFAAVAATSPQQGMMIFGGLASDFFSVTNDVHLYLTESNTWEAKSPTGTPPEEREGMSAVWVERVKGMLIFGGFGVGLLNDVHLYLLQANEWQQPATSGTAPSARKFHSAVWAETLQGMLVFAGEDGSGKKNDLHLFVEQTGAWSALNPGGTPPAARSEHAAVWFEGYYGLMLIFGGADAGGSSLNDLQLYDSKANTWEQLTVAGAPSARKFHTAVWAQSAGFLMFGGADDGASANNDLYSYLPEVPTSTTSTVSATTTSTLTSTMTTTLTSSVTSTATTLTATTLTATATTLTATTSASTVTMSTTVSLTSSTTSTTSTSVVEVPGCMDVTYSGTNIRALATAFRKAVARAAGVSEDMVQVFVTRGSICARVGDARRLQAAEDDDQVSELLAMTFVILFPSSMEEAANETQNKLDTISREQVENFLADEVSQMPSLATDRVSVTSDIFTGSVETVNVTTTMEGAVSGESPEGLGGGRSFAIVVGALILVCCIVALAFVAYKKCNKQKENAVTDVVTEQKEETVATTEEGFNRADLDV